MLALVLLAVSALLVLSLLQAGRSRTRRRRRASEPPAGPAGYRFQPKPPGVRTEVLRREIRRRRPRATARNQVWALDLTFAPLDSGETGPLLGVIDHGTRACLTLERLGTRTTIGVLRKLLDLIERFGKPRAVRTDNEALFTSKLARACLALLGIHHQRIERCAPWQNGRVERFFGTFKRALRELRSEQLTPEDLATFRTWYNHLRPHQGLNGLTPAQAWQGEALPPAARRKPVFVTAWRGVLRGFYVPK
jgi:putative transposase